MTELFGAALDATTTWVCLARRGVLIGANRSFSDALAAAGKSSPSLCDLLPCWGDHVGATTSRACPCPQLTARPDHHAAYCQAAPPRFPALITSQEVQAPDSADNLRLIVIEPRRGPRTAEPAQHVSHAMTQVRAALNEVEHRLLNELQTGVAMLRPGGLSAREWEVAQGLASGKRAPAVAAMLGISVHTVRNHLKSVFRKLNVSTQADLRRRLLTPGP
ncbi:MAG: LuxR C-terminal-related transcriptional regulator [Vicinamibacterales bacterium]